MKQLAQSLDVVWAQAPIGHWKAQLEPQLESDLGLEVKLRGTLEADEQAQKQSGSLLASLQNLDHELGAGASFPSWLVVLPEQSFEKRLTD